MIEGGGEKGNEKTKSKVKDIKRNEERAKKITTTTKKKPEAEEQL